MIKLPIRQLVELILRSGDIDSRYVSRDRMQQGAKAHRSIQQRNRRLFEDYQSEVWLSLEYNHNGIDYLLEGRADGVFKLEEGYIIDEIKTTTLPLEQIEEEFNDTHWAQAKCYAFMLGIRDKLQEVEVQLTYFNLETEETKRFLKSFRVSELEIFITELLEKYSEWARFLTDWLQVRDLSAQELKFPFPLYRKGQRELAVSVYRTIAGGQKLYAQAPTGIGKTISVLFPAVKALGEKKISKIFYLTAKTITRQVAQEAFARMREQGLKIKSLTLTAKEKICFCAKVQCQPEYCEYAKGHYDRVNEAILDALQNDDDLSRSTIEHYAQKHKVCPFELSLDLSLLADCVICDYNYVFDPRAFLRRFFAAEKNDYVFLIDEAHNLVDRSREMFSAELSKTAFAEIKKRYKNQDKQLTKVLNSINKLFIAYRKQCAEQDYFVTKEMPEELVKLIHKYTAVCELLLKEDKILSEDSEFLQLYFESLHFTAIADLYDHRYVTYTEKPQREVIVKLFCLDPSFLLAEALKRGSSAVLFSATLSPLPYFREMLGGTEEDKLLALDSPFDKRRLCVLTTDSVSTRYREREQSREQLVRLIATFVQSITGNYIVFFPSYKYLKDVYEEFVQAYPHLNVIEQQSEMTEQDREDFLDLFSEKPEKTLVAFCVLGGIFAEGIDLKGSRLIGTVIVGVGLPQLSVRQNIIKDYFDVKNSQGFQYAYLYPGMNKVLQAAGRVIRSENDIGAVLLIDDRYSQSNYLRLLPRHWLPYKKVKTCEALEKVLKSFWALFICQ